MDLQFSQQKLAWLLWLIFTVSICALIISTGHNRTVSLNYWLASNHWLHAQALYSLGGAGFLYFPQSAILYIPMGVLPFGMSEICWRIISLGMFAWGIYCFAILLHRSIFNQIRNGSSYSCIKSQGFFFLLITVIAIPLSFSSARNGQMHLFLCGMLMLASYTFSERQWWKSACLLLIALALKPTAIVLLLMLGGLYWAIGWRLFVGLFIFLLFPFLTQFPDYVWHQYLSVMISLPNTVAMGSGDWGQVSSLLTQFGLELSKNTQTVIRLVFALGVFGLGYLIKKRYSLNEAALWIFVLSMCYLLLFNPRTEGNGYFMLAPAVGFIMSRAIIRKQYFLVSSLVLGLLISSLGYYIAHVFTPGHSVWLDPLLGSLFFILVLFEIFRMLAKNSSLASSQLPNLSRQLSVRPKNDSAY